MSEKNTRRIPLPTEGTWFREIFHRVDGFVVDCYDKPAPPELAAVVRQCVPVDDSCILVLEVDVDGWHDYGDPWNLPEHSEDRRLERAILTHCGPENKRAVLSKELGEMLFQFYDIENAGLT